MRFSRPCFDKPHHCPGYAGGGIKYAKKQRCKSGYIKNVYGIGLHHCSVCNTIVLPYWVRWFSPGWWKWKLD